MVFVKQVIVASVVLFIISSLCWSPHAISFSQDVKGRELSDGLDNLADQIANDRDFVGSRLVAILADEQVSTLVRLQAADRLGKLQYLPAIPTLVRYIDLEPEIISPGGSRVEITRALGRCGNAAMPALVDEYLRIGITSTYPARGRQRAILRAIHAGGKAAENAKTYAHGIAAEGDAATRERVEWFIEDLEAHQENRRPEYMPLKHNTPGK